jgi:excisionase family DNA binding protein
MAAAESKKKSRFITVKEAAHELSIGPWTLWKWARENKSGCFPMKRIGKKILIPRQKFEDWCESTDNR